MDVLEIYPEGFSDKQKYNIESLRNEVVEKRKSVKLVLSGKYGTFNSGEFKMEDNQDVFGPYGKTLLPAKNRYVRDTLENRKLLSEKFGDSKISNFKQQTYLVIDIESKKWDPTFDFQWLYTNQPPLTPIEEILSI